VVSDQGDRREWGRLKAVSVVVEIRGLSQQGLNKQQIARRLGIHRETVARYLKGGALPAKKERNVGSRKADRYREHLEQRLAKYPELTAQQLYREIKKQGYQGSKRTLRRVVARMREKAGVTERRYRPVETLPGEQGQVDWGHCGRIEIEGQSLPLYVFVFTLGYSRWTYAEFTTSQDMATFLGCHRRAFAAAGGVPAEVLYDNAKTVTTSRVGHVVQLCEGLLRFAAGYGYRPRTCWIHDPEAKGKVENRVKFLKRSFLCGYELSTLEALNGEVNQWCAEVANGEVCAATGVPPGQRLAEEAGALHSLPAAPIEVAMIERRGVSRTGIIHWLGNTYSVPERLQRLTVQVHGFEDRLEVFHGQERVAVLPRLRGTGGRHIQDEHYGPRSGPRSKGDALQQRFEAIGPTAGDFLRGLARARRGHLREQAEEILGLCDQHGANTVHEALVRAATFGAYSYKTVKSIVARGGKALPEPPSPGRPAPLVVGAYPAAVVEERPLDYYAAGSDR
jgi:transposase